MHAIAPLILSLVISFFAFKPGHSSQTAFIVIAFVIGFASQIPLITKEDPNPIAVGVAITISIAAYLGTCIKKAVTGTTDLED
jgi:hypothetical protein